MEYFEAIDYVLALPDMERFSSSPQGHAMSLEAMRETLNRLGNPHLGRKTIHIAGSKGKGTTTELIAAMLESAGYKTGVFTSPHLSEYTERFRFGGRQLSPRRFSEAVEAVRNDVDAVNESDLGPMSTFGALLAAYFWLCREEQVEFQVVEVGLGGLMDATNIFEQKDFAVITSISLEHTVILGNTLEEIAEHKAGIITPGTRVVIAKQPNDSVVKTIRQVGERNRAAGFVEVGNVYHASPISHDSQGQTFVLHRAGRDRTLHTSLLGLHQIDNISTAVAVIDSIASGGTTVPDDAIQNALSNFDMPGRIEQVNSHPLIVLDGAHNGASARALAAALERHFDYDRLFLILGVNTDKKIEDIAEALLELEPYMVLTTRSSNQKAMDPKQVAQSFSTRGFSNLDIGKNVALSLEKARALAGRNDLICVTGSLYIVGEARDLLLPESAWS